MKLYKVLIFTFLSTLFLIETHAQNAQQVLMSVGDEKITVEEFWNIYQKNNTEKSFDKKSIDEYLVLYTNFRLKVNEAKSLKKDTIPAFKKELLGYREQLAKPYLVDEDINETLMTEAYERMQKDVRVSHILLFLDEDALPEDTARIYNKINKIRDRIVSNELAFEEAAVKFSDDRSAQDAPAEGQRPARVGNKGDLGYFTVFDMVYPFEVAAYSLPLNQISMPVRTRFGYHLIVKTDEIPAIGKAQVAHIFIKDIPGDSAYNPVASKEKIDQIYARLQNGESFEDLVKTMSDDKGSAVKGGELPWFGANRMVPIFIKQVSEFKTIGEVSKPVQTMYGWHIVKFLGQKPIGSFESVKNEIKDRLKKDVRSEKGRQSKIAQVKKEEGFTENPQALQELVNLLDSTLLEHKFDLEKAKGFTQELFTIGNQSYNQYQLVDYIQKSGKKASINDYKKYTYKKYQEFVDNKVIEYEDQHLEVKYPDFAMLMNEYRDGILLFDLMDEVVWSKAVKDTTGYQNYFKQHQSEYNWDKRVDASIYTFTNPEVFATVQGLIQLKKSDQDILAEINNDSLKAVKFERRKFSEGDNKDVDETKWKAGSYKVFKNDQGTPLTLVRIQEKLNPAPKTLDECRGMVISDYQNQLEKEWVDSLRTKYTVVVDQAVLEDVKKNGLKK